MRLNFTANIAPIYTSIKLFSAFVCLFFSINFIAAQKINDAEYKYFIQKQVKNPTLQAELQKIHENIILGKYDKSLELIKNTEIEKIFRLLYEPICQTLNMLRGIILFRLNYVIPF